MYINDELKPGMRNYLKKSIWTSFLQGLGAVVFGIYAFISPIGTLGIFMSIIGLLLLFHGGLLVVSALMGVKRDGMCLPILAAGLLQLLLGLFIVSRAEGLSATAVMLSTVGMGLIGVVSGTVSLIAAIKYRDVASNVWPFISRGGLFFIIGISMLLAPFGFGTAMVRAVGLIAALLGILQTWSAVKLFKEMKAC